MIKTTKTSNVYLSMLLIIALLLSLFSPMAGVNAETAYVSLESFSGKTSEWNNITHDTIIRSSTLNSMKAVQSGNKLYVSVSGTVLDTGESTIYIDSDKNIGTGCPISGWKDSGGIDYKLVNTNLYKYSSGDWEQVQNAEVNIIKTDSVFEAEIKISDLGLTESKALRISFYKDGASCLPEISNNMMQVNEAEGAVYGPGIKDLNVDGSNSEWEGISPLLSTAAGTTKVYSVICNDRLSVLIEGQISLADFGAFWEFLYIDTDKNSSTGNSTWVAPGIGVDYAVQTGSLYRGDGSGGWTQVTEADLLYSTSGSGANKVIEWSVPLSSLGLSPISNINLAFYGDDQNTGVGLAAVYPAKPDTSPSIIVNVDGNPSEWSGVKPLLTSAAGTTSVSAIMCDNKLNALIEGQISDAEFGAFWEFFYIDTDKNSATGNKPWMFTELGAEFAIQTGILYKGDGSGGWTEVTGSTIALSYSTSGSGNNKIIELSVPISNLDMDSEKSINIAFFSDANNQSTGIATVKPNSSATGAEIVIDEALDDWAAIDNTVNASGVSTELYAVQDGKRLYTLVKGNNLNTRNIYYIDSDNDSNTGYSYDGLWADSGIDFVVDSSKLYRTTGSNIATDKMLVGDVYTYYTDTGVEMHLDLSQLGKATSGDMKIGYIGKGTLDIPAVTGEMAVTNKSITRELLSDTYYPNEYYGVLNNPYMGWVPWAEPSEKEQLQANTDYAQPHRLVYAGLSWKDLEPSEGEYAWDIIESKYQFNYWASIGCKVNIRVVMDTPSSQVHKDIPDWLYEKIGGDGTQYDNTSIGKGFSPNYNNETLIAQHKKLIEAIAAKYKNDSRIGYIQLGSLGHWGEWHCWPYDGTSVTGVFPGKEVSDQYVQHYIDAFGDSKKLNMRRGYGLAKDNQFGLFNDMFGDLPSLTSAGWGWLDQIQNGYTDDFGAQQPAMPEFWVYGPSGGEFANGNSFLYLTDDTIMSSLNQARVSHTSWLGPCCPAKYEGGELQNNIDALLNTIGYRFVIESLTHTKSIKAGDILPISIKINNKGVAPFYFDWSLSVSLADAQGRIVAKINTTEDIKNWLPGRTTVDTQIRLPANIASGEYTICLSIDDPDTGNPGLDFANTGRRNDGSYSLDTVTVTRDSSGGTDTNTSGTSYDSNLSVINSDNGIIASPKLENGTAKVEINQTDISDAINKAKADSKGSKTVNIVLSKTAGARDYECTLPASVLSAKDGAQKFKLQTEYADVVLPGNMLASGSESKVSLCLTPGDKIKLTADVKNLIGNRPLIEISLKKDGKPAEWSNEDVLVKIDIPYTPTAEELKNPEYISIYFIDGSGKVIPVPNGRYDAKNGKVSFTTTHFSNYAISFVNKTFSDLTGHEKERPMIEVLAAKGITNGTGATTFSPDKNISRADFVVMLVKTLGLSAKIKGNFIDVNQKDYFWEAVGIAKAVGITAGTGNNNFSPKEEISRQDALVMAMKALQLKGDISDISDTSVLNSIRPRDNMTRAEAAVILYNLYYK